jgi:hypothetical protein
MWKTYRNYHDTEAAAAAMAADERANGPHFGGWYRRLAEEEAAEARRQAEINMANGHYMMVNADSVREAYGA